MDSRPLGDQRHDDERRPDSGPADEPLGEPSREPPGDDRPAGERSGDVPSTGARARATGGRAGRPDAAGLRAARLDATDHALIGALQQDGRASYAALAKEVGLSEAAVRQRVQRLRDSGVMQIIAVTDPMTVNLARQAMVGVRVEGDTRDVARQLAALAQVDYVVLCAGSFDILCEITCENDQQLLTLLNTGVRGVPGVVSTESFVYLQLAKQTYAWGALTGDPATPRPADRGES